MSKSGIILAVLAIGLVIAIVAVSSLFKTLTETPETFIVGKEFIEDLAAKDIDGAVELAVSELQTAESRAELEAFVADNADLFSSSTEAHLTGRGIDNDLRYAYGTITSGDIEAPLYMEFMDDNGETRVSYFSFNEDDINAHNSDNAADQE
ncbi:MAG: hypothetical protein AAB776_01640 [Patescibacteria group bacterium]